MKKIVLLGAAPIDGETRYPSEGEIEVAPSVADDLVGVGLAKEAALSGQTVADLRQTAVDELVDVPPAAGKAELVETIAEARKGR